MTTEITENKTVNNQPKKAEPKKAEPKAAHAPSAPSGSGSFEFELLPLPEAVAGSGHITIDPKKIMVSKYDARAQPAPVTDDLVASIKDNGIIQDPLVTYARSKGGEEGWLIVAGRRRREAAIKVGLKEISAKAVELKSFKDYLIMAGDENLKRQNMSAWDVFTYLSDLMVAGLKQSELKDVLHVTDGYVSQYLAIGKLDERVQKHVRAATDEPFKSHAPTCVRELKRVDDPEEQVAFAQMAVTDKMSPAALKFVIEKWLDKQAAKAAQGDKENVPAKGGSRSVKLPDEITPKDLNPLPKADMATFLNFARNKYTKLKASEKATPEGVAYARGVMDALLQVNRMKDLPTKLQGDE